MSHHPPESPLNHHGPNEPKAFIIWNQRLAAVAAAAAAASSTATSTPGSVSSDSFILSYDDVGNSSGDFSSFSSDGHILPISESSEALPEELECSELKPKGPLYNIIQSKMNLSEKRGPKFLCQECHYPTNTRLSMVTHMKMHLRPFCEVCFAIFDCQETVHTHIRATHPEVVLLGESKDFYCMQTIAPPNTPTPLSDDEMKTIEGLVNPIVKYPFSFQNCHEETEGEATNEDEPRLVIDDGPRPRGRPKKSQINTPVVKRTLKKKKAKKVKVEDVTPDNVLKKITSRFGRSISLKMPQF